MARNSTGAVHDQAGITASGNREERDAQVERIQERHERVHRPDEHLTVKASATTTEVADLADVPTGAQPSDGGPN